MVFNSIVTYFILLAALGVANYGTKGDFRASEGYT